MKLLPCGAEVGEFTVPILQKWAAAAKTTALSFVSRISDWSICGKKGGKKKLRIWKGERVSTEFHHLICFPWKRIESLEATLAGRIQYSIKLYIYRCSFGRKRVEPSWAYLFLFFSGLMWHHPQRSVKLLNAFKIFQCRSLPTMRKHARAVSVKSKCIEMIIIWPNLILSPAFSGKWKNTFLLHSGSQPGATILSNPWGPTLRMVDHRCVLKPKRCRVLPGGNVTTESHPTKSQEGFMVEVKSIEKWRH